MRIEVLISTYNDGIYQAINVPLPQQDGLSYLICHQVSDNFAQPDESFLSEFINSRSDIRYLRFKSLGLAKNRNNGIKHSLKSSDILYFCDDDVVLDSDFYSKVNSSFLIDDHDAVTFKVSDLSGNPFKNYKTSGFIHNNISLLKVSSIELAVRRKFLANINIFFDESFGIGSKYIASEENIFLCDLYKSGAKIAFQPTVTIYHPLESSGKNWSDEKLVASKGPFFKRVFGTIKGALLLLVFSLKKYPEYKNSLSLARFCYISFSAFSKYKG